MTQTTFFDRQKGITSITGTGGSYTIDSISAGYQAFIGTLTQFFCVTDGTDWEVFIGAYNGTTAVVRTSVLSSSNSGSAVNWGSGNKDIFCVIPAAYLNQLRFDNANINSQAAGMDSGLDDAMAMGPSATGRRSSHSAFGHGIFTDSAGNVVRSQQDLGAAYGETNDATPTQIYGTSGSDIKITDVGVYYFEITVAAVEVTGAVIGDIKIQKHTGCLKHDGTTLSLFGTVTTTTLQADAGASAWSSAITVDDANKALDITVTGEAATDLDWSASIILHTHRVDLAS